MKIFFILFIFSCARNSDWVKKINNNDYSIVILGTFPHTTKMVKDTKGIERIIKEIERNKNLLNKITNNFYKESALNFNYKFTSKFNDTLVIRYFGNIINEKYAGYQVQFIVYKNKIEKIYLFKQPLD